MTVRYDVTGPVANGDYFTTDMGADFGQCELSSILFFNAGGAQVTPTAGTVLFTGTPDNQVWRTVENGAFNAAAAYDMNRQPPFATGLMVKAKVTLAGIVGASTFSAIVWRK